MPKQKLLLQQKLPFTPYSAAEMINGQIFKILCENPITAENALKWMNFCRTVESTLKIINDSAHKEIRKKGGL